VDDVGEIPRVIAPAMASWRDRHNSCSDFLNVTFFPGLNKVMPLKFAKPIRRKIEKTNRRKAKNAHIAKTRQLVLERDGRCRACASTVFLEMHEMKSRAQLRGKPPEEIFNSFNCIMLCSTCHRQVTERMIDVVPVDEQLGANGRVNFQRRLV
jgi:5-methylcytosine-specific restriction endonuclease McrA